MSPPLNVLVVDDSTAMRAMIKKTLAAAGFSLNHCFEAANGRAALDIIRANQLDVVLCDLHMPEMTGLELLEALQKENRVPRCFILVTTEGRRDRLQKALGFGARGYVVKPFQPEGLRKILSLFVGEPDGPADDESLTGLDF
ncbi:MAG: response regulator [Deltaproteobacteria bacterium]|nr:response regulator [Deltaproteobacteria bacterium]